MSFRLSLASLVDQSELPLRLASAYATGAVAALPQAPGQMDAVERSIPQVFLINPATDNIFRHIDTENAHAAIIGLIYFSMWMGALGSDIVSTIFFDIRVVRETTWSSVYSSIYSIAYLFSRYISLAWILTAVTNSVIMTPSCDPWMKASTALFSIAISATMLVFCLRTCSIWQMRTKVVVPVVGAWILVVSFAILLPTMSNGTRIESSNFCAWHFNGLYVVGVFASLLLFDVLCLALTVSKLNKAGWRGIACALFPGARHNYDAEDVKTMLVQKTTAFFVIQFVFLTSALLLYVLNDRYAYKLMNIVASVAVASSMAGRIFRKAWRQTREWAPERLNRPPSYYPAWADEHLDRRDASDPALLLAGGLSGSRPGTSGHHSSSSGGGGAEMGHVGGGGHGHGAVKRSGRRRPDSLDFYVEGEFGLKPYSASAVSLRSCGGKNEQSGQPPSIAASAATAAQTYAAQQLQALYAMDSVMVEGGGEGGAGGGVHYSRGRPYRPYGGVGASFTAGDDDGEKIRAVEDVSSGGGMLAHSMALRSAVSYDPAASTDGLVRGVVPIRRTSEEARAINQALTPALREDLNPTPSYSRLHLLSDGFSQQQQQQQRHRRSSNDSSGGDDPYTAGGPYRNVRSGGCDRLGTADSSASSAAAAGALFAFLSFAQAASADADAGTHFAWKASSYFGDAAAAAAGRWKRRPSAISTTLAAVEPEDRRRRFVASPPMSAGARMSTKEESRKVYDVESVKAAARIEPLPSAAASSSMPRQTMIRPYTTSNLELRRGAADSQPDAAVISPDGSPKADAAFTAATKRVSAQDANSSCPPGASNGNGSGVGDASASSGIIAAAAGRSSHDSSSHSPDQLTPRPKTAPAWPSPHLSPSESLVSQLILGSGATSSISATVALRAAFDDDAAASADGVDRRGGLPSSDGEDDALFAFRQTIEQDSLEMGRITRSRAGRSRSGTSTGIGTADGDRAHRALSSREDGDLRPRTSRGAGLNAQGRAQTADGVGGGGDDEEDADSAQTHRVNGPVSSQDRPRPRSAHGSQSRSQLQQQSQPNLQRPKSRPDTAKSRAAASARPTSSYGRRLNSSAGSRSRSRLTSADGSISSRPSTAAGEDVKPFGFGILNHRNGLTSASSLATGTDCCDSDDDGSDGDDDKTKLARFGSAIERQYAKLAAEAGMSLDLP